MVRIMTLEASYVLPTFVSPTSPLWYVSARPKCLLLAKFVTLLSLLTFHLSRRARYQKGNIEEGASVVIITV